MGFDIAFPILMFGLFIAGILASYLIGRADGYNSGWDAREDIENGEYESGYERVSLPNEEWYKMWHLPMKPVDDDERFRIRPTLPPGTWVYPTQTKTIVL